MEILADFVTIGIEATLLRGHHRPLSKSTRNVNGDHSLIRGFLNVCGGGTSRLLPLAKIRLHCICIGIRFFGCILVTMHQWYVKQNKGNALLWWCHPVGLTMEHLILICATNWPK